MFHFSVVSYWQDQTRCSLMKTVHFKASCLGYHVHDLSSDPTVYGMLYDLVDVVIRGKEIFTPNATSSESFSF